MKKIFFLFIAFLVSLASAAQSKTVEIWIRAFIPDPQNAGGGTGYLHTLPTGGSSISLHNINNSLPNMCYATDHRGFSNSSNSTSRLETRFSITHLNGNTGKILPEKNRTTAAITKKLDCTTGAVLEQKMGSVDKDFIGTPAVADGTVQVIGQVQGKNLLTPAGSLGPAVDYSFDIQWNPGESSLKAAVTIGSFPAFEMYARQPHGNWLPVFQQLPTGAPWKLGGDGFGINSTRIVTIKKIPGITGKWQTAMPEQRFTFEFTGNKVKWTEKNAAGVLLTHEAAATETTEGKIKIERPNSSEVLTFLGFQPALKSEILVKTRCLLIFFYTKKITAWWPNGMAFL